MSQGKRAASGFCDYCLVGRASRAVGDGSEACWICARVLEINKDLIKRVQRAVGRNERCPCGSGKKFKRCCWLASREMKGNGDEPVLP